MSKGDWYSWNVDDWDLGTDNPNITYRIVNESISDVCNLAKAKWEYFPDHNSFFDNHKLCKQFEGTTADTSTQKLVNNFVTRHCDLHGHPFTANTTTYYQIQQVGWLWNRATFKGGQALGLLRDQRWKFWDFWSNVDAGIYRKQGEEMVWKTQAVAPSLCFTSL